MCNDREYIIFHDYSERLTEADVPKRWPMHITMASWYVLGSTDYEDMIETVSSIASNCSPFLFKAGEPAQFGPNHDIPVTKLIDVEGMLGELHTTIVEDLGKIGCRFVETDNGWTSDAFVPHIAHRAGESIPTCHVEFDGLTIASRRITDHQQKLIDKVIPLR